MVVLYSSYTLKGEDPPFPPRFFWQNDYLLRGEVVGTPFARKLVSS